jgi:hypothetical protein
MWSEERGGKRGNARVEEGCKNLNELRLERPESRSVRELKAVV